MISSLVERKSDNEDEKEEYILWSEESERRKNIYIIEGGRLEKTKTRLSKESKQAQLVLRRTQVE
jgi:hypothetical protein